MDLGNIAEESLKKFRIQSESFKKMDSPAVKSLSPGKMRGREINTHSPESQRLESRIAFKSMIPPH